MRTMHLDAAHKLRIMFLIGHWTNFYKHLCVIAEICRLGEASD